MRRTVQVAGLALVFVFLLVAQVEGRGGGGCVLEGSLVDTPQGPRRIEELRVGDSVWSVLGGQRLEGCIRAVHVTEVRGCVVLRGQGFELRTTAEHPVATKVGEFRAAGSLVVGDGVVVKEGENLVVRSIQEIVRSVGGDARDFSVMPGGTFFAGGVLVHNKGCFLPGTLVKGADGRELPIESVREGFRILAFEADERVTVATVGEVYRFEVPGWWRLRTEVAELCVTGEHPLYVGSGAFRTVDGLRVGDEVYEGTSGVLRPSRVIEKEWVPEFSIVYNLRTDAPHTYFAHGIAVHNKGGGGGGRGFSSRHSSGFVGRGGGSGGKGLSEEERMMVVGMIFAAYAGVAIFVWRSVRNRRRVQEGGLISRLRWKPRADRARALLDEVSRLDRELAPTTILERFRETFLRLQHCWSEQEYSGMADLMTAQLYQEHLEKLAVQVSAGERNVLEGIVIRECEVVCVRYWAERDRREIAVLFEVSMVDYFAKRETGAFLRGRRTPSTFQEVWWFRLGFGGWRLSKIEQTAETSVLEMTDVNEVPISAGSGNGL